MTLPEDLDGTLPPDETGEEEMAHIQCPACGQLADLVFMRPSHSTASRDIELRGLAKCSCGGAGNEWAVGMKTDNVVQPTEILISESANLHKGSVPDALVEDLQAAEKTHFALVYRASVVMCRRALQLAFQEPKYMVEDGPYGKMLQKLMKLSGPPLSPGAYGLAVSIGDYGGTGAHDPKPVTAEQARSAIFTAVQVLNELF